MNKTNLFILAALASASVNVMAADAITTKSDASAEQRAKTDKGMSYDSRTGAATSGTSKPMTATEKPMAGSEQRSDTMRSSQGSGMGNTGSASGSGHNMGSSSAPGASGTVGMSMTGGMMGSHAMSGKITKINHKTGKVTVSTDEGKMDVHFPTAEIQDLKKGDSINLHMGYTRG